DRSISRIFDQFGTGVATNRDVWVYGFSRDQVVAQSSGFIREFNEAQRAWLDRGAPTPVVDYVTSDKKKISWSSGLRTRFASGRQIGMSTQKLRLADYRPFNKQHLFANIDVLERPSAIGRFFASESMAGPAIYLT